MHYSTKLYCIKNTKITKWLRKDKHARTLILIWDASQSHTVYRCHFLNKFSIWWSTLSLYVLRHIFHFFIVSPNLKISGLGKTYNKYACLVSHCVMAVDSLEPLSSAIPVAQDVLIWKESWFIQRERKRNCRASPGNSRKFGWRVVGVWWSGRSEVVVVE